MARIKEFDRDEALDAAIAVFREHGFEGTSTEMLLKAMKIGRQSLYDTFGDKWKLYCLAVERYSASETSAHIALLRGKPRALEGIRLVMERVVDNAIKLVSASTRSASSVKAGRTWRHCITPPIVGLRTSSLNASEKPRLQVT